MSAEAYSPPPNHLPQGIQTGVFGARIWTIQPTCLNSTHIPLSQLYLSWLPLRLRSIHTGSKCVFSRTYQKKKFVQNVEQAKGHLRRELRDPVLTGVGSRREGDPLDLSSYPVEEGEVSQFKSNLI